MRIAIRPLILLMVTLCFTTVAFGQETNREDLINAIKAEVTPELIQSFDSPGGLSSAEVHVYPCTGIGVEVISYEQLNIIDLASSQSTLLADQLIYCGGLGTFGLWVTDWTENYIYYTDGREGSPDGFGGFWTRIIWRGDLATLTAESLGQALFSPDRQWLLSLSSETIRLISADSDDMVKFPLKPDSLELVNVIWLPDNSGALYIQSDSPFVSTESSVTHIDLATLEQTIILTTGE